MWYNTRKMVVSSHSNYIFEVNDWRGRIVRLTKATFEKHTKRHLEFVNYIEAAKQTIKDPDFVAEADNGALALFRFGLGDKPFERLYLQVIVYYNKGEGREATHHFVTKLGDLRLIETRYLCVAGSRIRLVGESNERPTK